MKNLTKYLLLLSILSLFGYSVSAQNQGTKNTKPKYKPATPEYLLVKRGFKIFKLGTPIEQYKKYVLADKDTQGVNKTYKVMLDKNPKFATMGEAIKIKDIVLEVYDGLIIAISVFVEDKYKKDFLRLLRTAYGPGEKQEGSPYVEEYIWYASSKKPDVSLIYVGSYLENSSVPVFALFKDNKLMNKILEQDKKNKANEALQDL